MYDTKMVRIVGTDYEIEETPGSFVLWAPCTDRSDEWIDCGGEGSRIVATCGKDENGSPDDKAMVQRVTGLERFDLERIQ